MPTKIVARLVSMIGRRVSICVDTSGCAARRSQSHQPTRTMMPPAAQPRVCSEVQPHELPWVIANSIADSPAARPAAPSQSMDPGRTARARGTTNTTMAMTRTVNAVVSQNTRW